MGTPQLVAPTKPEDLMVAAHALTGDVTLTWEAVAAAGRYDWRYRSGSLVGGFFVASGSWTIVNGTTSAAAASIALGTSAVGTWYEFEVRAVRTMPSVQNSEWSDSVVAQVGWQALGAPVLSFMTGDTYITGGLMLRWTEVAGAGGYQVQVDTRGSFGELTATDWRDLNGDRPVSTGLGATFLAATLGAAGLGLDATDGADLDGVSYTGGALSFRVRAIRETSATSTPVRPGAWSNTVNPGG